MHVWVVIVSVCVAVGFVHYLLSVYSVIRATGLIVVL